MRIWDGLSEMTESEPSRIHCPWKTALEGRGGLVTSTTSCLIAKAAFTQVKALGNQRDIVIDRDGEIDDC